MEDDTGEQLRALGLEDEPEISMHIMQVPKSTVMFRAGESCRRYPVVLAGSVRICRMGPRGHDIVFYRVQKGEGCVMSAGCLMENQRYPASGVADRDTRALLLPASLFRAYLASNTAFRDFVFRQYSMRIITLMARVDSLISEGPGARLAKYLLARVENGTVATTHAKLAADIGTAREVVSRNLGMLVRAGWIRQRRQAIEVIDIPALQALVDGDNHGQGKRVPSYRRKLVEAADHTDRTARS